MGQHFLQIPGPSPEPDEVLRAVSRMTIDHRGPEFQDLGSRVLNDIRQVFGTSGPVIIYSASGTGAWEGALVNTLSPGDEVLFYAAGHFATLWCDMAERLGLVVRRIDADWRRAIDAEQIAAALRADARHVIKAVCVVHNETSTGIVNDIPSVRSAITDSDHPALLMVDTVSGLGSADYQHDAWGVDVSISGSQKGLMLPPGLGFNAVSSKALEASEQASLPRSYWDWKPILTFNEQGFWPTTPSTNLLYGLDASLRLIFEEGLSRVLARHEQLGRATRAAVEAWGLELTCLDSSAYSPVVTSVMLPDGYDSNAFRTLVLAEFDMSLGTGLGELAGKAFRIGHLGWINSLTLVGALGGVEMGLLRFGVPLRDSGMTAALKVLQEGLTPGQR